MKQTNILKIIRKTLILLKKIQLNLLLQIPKLKFLIQLNGFLILNYNKLHSFNQLSFQKTPYNLMKIF